MTYQALLMKAGGLPMIDTQTLRALGAQPRALSVQLSRWVKQAKLIPLRRGKFLLPEPLRRSTPPLEHLANLLVVPSYVSLERALAFYGLIPERVPLVQSVTPGKPMLFRTAVGGFGYQHVKADWFFGYSEMQVGAARALIASPEKALLDLVHLQPGRLSLDWLASLRLQELQMFDLKAMRKLAIGHGERLEKAAREVAQWIQRERR